MALCMAYDSGGVVSPTVLLTSFEACILTYCFLQNDLVHGWGLDFALRKCVEVYSSSILL